MSDPATLDLCAAAAAVADRRLSSQELTRACLDRIARLDPHLNAFIEVEAEAALAAARQADAAVAAGRPLGPLHGVPLAHKDMFYRAGRPCTCGSGIRRGFVPGTTAEVIRRLEAAGAITLGTLNMAELAIGPTGHNVHFGRCRNPWNGDFITGGSSCGSGAAVAARLVYGALGSDTGGSIRLPAAMCGVVGLKPTQGLVSQTGIMGLSQSLDCVGPLARSARDVARLLTVIAGPDGAAAPESYERALARDLSGVRLGLPAAFYYDDLAPEVADALEAARRVLEALGARTVEVELPDQGPLADLANLAFLPEAAALHLAWLRARPQDYGPQVRARLLQGLAVPAVSYLQAHQLRALHAQAMIDGPLARCDALLVPACPRTVPASAETDVEDGAQMATLLADLTRFTRPLSYLGLPGLVTPAGFDRRGLPVALQLIGRPFGEATLLALAHAYEGATGWLARVPPETGVPLHA